MRQVSDLIEHQDAERNKQLMSETKLEAELKQSLAEATSQLRILEAIINELSCQINEITEGKGYESFMGIKYTVGEGNRNPEWLQNTDVRDLSLHGSMGEDC